MTHQTKVQLDDCCLSNSDRQSVSYVIVVHRPDSFNHREPEEQVGHRLAGTPNSNKGASFWPQINRSHWKLAGFTFIWTQVNQKQQEIETGRTCSTEECAPKTSNLSCLPGINPKSLVQERTSFYLVDVPSVDSIWLFLDQPIRKKFHAGNACSQINTQV